MKKNKIVKKKIVYGALTVGLLIAAFIVAVIPAGAAGTPSITLVNPPAGGVLELAVGQSYTFNVAVASDQPFTTAIATLDQQYPGRGIFASSPDSSRAGTSAALSLTVTGKEATLGATNVPGGLVPVSIVVAVRYQGGQVVTQRFDFAVIVR